MLLGHLVWLVQLRPHQVRQILQLLSRLRRRHQHRHQIRAAAAFSFVPSQTSQATVKILFIQAVTTSACHLTVLLEIATVFVTWETMQATTIWIFIMTVVVQFSSQRSIMTILISDCYRTSMLQLKSTTLVKQLNHTVEKFSHSKLMEV